MKRMLLRGEAMSATSSRPVLFLLLLAALACARARADVAQQAFEVSDRQVRISAGILERVIDLRMGI